MSVSLTFLLVILLRTILSRKDMCSNNRWMSLYVQRIWCAWGSWRYPPHGKQWTYLLRAAVSQKHPAGSPCTQLRPWIIRTLRSIQNLMFFSFRPASKMFCWILCRQSKHLHCLWVLHLYTAIDTLLSSKIFAYPENFASPMCGFLLLDFVCIFWKVMRQGERLLRRDEISWHLCNVISIMSACRNFVN